MAPTTDAAHLTHLASPVEAFFDLFSSRPTLSVLLLGVLLLVARLVFTRCVWLRWRKVAAPRSRYLTLDPAVRSVATCANEEARTSDCGTV